MKTGKHSGKKASPGKKGHWISEEELGVLQQKLNEAQETLSAIQNGEVDAVVVSGTSGSKIYSLAGAEQPYRVYVESMQEGAVTVSPQGLILYCNQRFAEMLGVPLKRVISSEIFKYLGAETWQRISTVFGGHETVAKHEAILQCSKKRTLPVHLSASELPLEDQNVMCLVVTDLSAQQENAALRLARDLAEKASSSKDAFLAALSHELRTPLTPALLAAAALEQDRTLPDHVLENLSMIRRNVELETRLIDDLLDLTRIANNKLELHRQSEDLHVILHRACEICRSEIDEKRLKIEVHESAAKTAVDVDPVRMQQALWNLIRNAVKFTPEGGRISITTQNPRAGMVRVEVKDTGIGFAPETEGRIFDAFTQAGRSITRQFGGLGLGLAITRSIVEMHGGSISARSAGLHKGATFSVELPVEVPKKSRQTAPKPAGETAPVRSMRILLVEDHDDTRHSMSRLLHRFGHQVQAAENAAGALILAEAGSFDLVISDLGLPDQNGEDLMGQLRDRFGLVGVAVSGYGMEEDVARSRIGGFSHHLTKPIQIDRLKELIEEIAREASSASSGKRTGRSKS